MKANWAKNIPLLRLISQRLVASDLADVASVVGKLLAMQAQDFNASLWAIGTRLPGSTIDDVYSAYNKASIVRSWPMRGTLHAMRAEDLRWVLDITAQRTLKGVIGRQERLSLDDSMIADAKAVALELLARGGQATPTQFVQAIADNGVPVDNDRGYHMIWFLAHHGVICWGPVVGKQQMLVLCDEWLPKSRKLSRENGLGQFLARYLEGHGPATLKDFAWWNKLTVVDSKLALEATRDVLTEIQFDKTSYWMHTVELNRADEYMGVARKSALALPAFDEYLLGYQDRSLVLAPEFADLVMKGANGMFLPILVESAQVTATWKKTTSKAAVKVDLDPFSTVKANARVLESAFDTYGRFLGLPASV